MNEKINKIEYKINSAEKNIKEIIKSKHELLLSMIKIIENKTTIKSKTFNHITKRKNNKKITFNDDKTFNKCYLEIKQIFENEKKAKTLKNDLLKYDDKELHIISLRTYYNKYTLIYNNLIKKFPYIIIAKIKKYKLKVLFEGEELDINN